MSNVQAHCARGKIAANNMADIEEEIFAASKFISSFSPEATASSASNPKETSVLGSKIFMKIQKVSSSTASDNAGP